MSEKKQCRATLPASFFYDPAQYERELEAIWYQDWICVGHENEWREEGDYRLSQVGGQQVVVTRGKDGELRAFHNTCRHRGSILCQENTGRFNNGRIVCPYHAWTYSLEGDLQRTPRRVDSADFRKEDFSLYGVALELWRGFVFVNLAAEPGRTLQQALPDECHGMSKWPLEQLQLAHRESHKLACNWKIFWENFLECYHCPGVHPELCSLVPVYRSAMNAGDEERMGGGSPDPSVSQLVAGAVTWSMDGQTNLPWFSGLSEEERTVGMTFATMLPTMYMVTHVDYVRTVRVVPHGPEQTELVVDWLLHPEALQQPGLDTEKLAEFGRLVVTQDARVCELNQRGLHCMRHEQGVLVPQEHDVFEFEQWLRQRLGQALQ